MSNVINLRDPDIVDALWEEYRVLAQATRDDPALLTDRAHAEATIRAYRRFSSAFLISEKAA